MGDCFKFYGLLGKPELYTPPIAKIICVKSNEGKSVLWDIFYDSKNCKKQIMLKIEKDRGSSKKF